MTTPIAKITSLLIAPLQHLNRFPVLYRGQRFQLVGYGAFAALAAVSAMSLTLFYLHLKGAELGVRFIALLPLLGLGVWLGSRLLHIRALGEKFFQNPKKYLTETGFYVQGGIYGGIAASAAIAPMSDLPLIVLWDGMAWSAPLALVFGRLGCYNYGCCYGRETHSHFGVSFHNTDSKVLRLKPHLQGVNIHPSQLYTAYLHLLTFLLATALIPMGLPNGLLAGGFLVYHGISRLVIERFRDDIFFHEGRNWTTFRNALIMASMGILLLLVGPLLNPSIGQSLPLVAEYSPLTLQRLFTAQPVLYLAVAFLGVLVLLGFGVHGRKLGTFPWSPENQEGQANKPATASAGAVLPLRSDSSGTFDSVPGDLIPIKTGTQPKLNSSREGLS